jgi:hypothetical protein
VPQFVTVALLWVIWRHRSIYNFFVSQTFYMKVQIQNNLDYLRLIGWAGGRRTDFALAGFSVR